MSREQKLTRALVGLADTLAADFDPLSLFHRLVQGCVEVLDVEAAAVIIGDRRGRLRTMAASQDEAAFLGMLQSQADAGPCAECYRTGQALGHPDIARERERWPHFVPAALGIGFHAVHAVPMRLHERVIGVVGLFRTRGGDLSPDQHEVAQALTDVAALAFVHWSHEPATPQDVLSRVEGAIASKALLETANGMVAEEAGVSVAEASAMLREYAARNSIRLSDTARALTTRDLALSTVTESASAGRGPATRRPPRAAD